MKLVVFPPADPRRIKQIQEVDPLLQVANPATEDEVLQELVDADAYYGRLNPRMLAAAQKLRWVQSPTAAMEHFLFPELIEHPCVVTNMRGLYSDVIADHVFAMILCFARNLHLYIRNQLTAKWEAVGGEQARHPVTAGVPEATAIDRAHRHLSDCTVGVIGTGAIGAEVLRRGAAFGMNLLGLDPVVREISGCPVEVLPQSEENLEKLLGASDYVVIAAPHTPETYKLIRRPQLQTMRRDAFLINIGRGVIVDLADLTDALTAREIAGAGLDVFEIEPLPKEHPLWKFPNVLITPHLAAASPRIAERHLDTLLQNLRLFLQGKPLLTPVDKQKWY